MPEHARTAPAVSGVVISQAVIQRKPAVTFQVSGHNPELLFPHPRMGWVDICTGRLGPKETGVSNPTLGLHIRDLESVWRAVSAARKCKPVGVIERSRISLGTEFRAEFVAVVVFDQLRNVLECRRLRYLISPASDRLASFRPVPLPARKPDIVGKNCFRCPFNPSSFRRCNSDFSPGGDRWNEEILLDIPRPVQQHRRDRCDRS